MLSGPNLPLYTRLMETFPQVVFTLSGGVASLDDLVEAQNIGVQRAIVGKALYEGRVNLRNLEYLNSPV